MGASFGSVRIVIVGIGNCATSLVEAIEGYRQHGPAFPGIMNNSIDSLTPGDIEVVGAIDIDARKVGKSLKVALQASPNCSLPLAEILSEGPTVVCGPVMDGVASHMTDYGDHASFRTADCSSADVPAYLRECQPDVLVSYLPVGSDEATQYYAGLCLEHRIAMVNCAPSFIASDALWATRFREAGVAIVGDDIKSQFGATYLHRCLVNAMMERGVAVKRTYQLNVGGNTDFLNMLARDRLVSKKLSKTRAVTSQFDQVPDQDVHIGPSDYVPWLKDNKVAMIRIEAEGLGGTPIELEVRLSVQDSPNSAGIVLDAIRCVAAAQASGMSGPIEPACAWMMKSPPSQMPDEEARCAYEELLVKFSGRAKQTAATDHG